MKYWELSKFTLEKLLDEKNVLGIMNIEGVKIVHKVDRLFMYKWSICMNYVVVLI